MYIQAKPCELMGPDGSIVTADSRGEMCRKTGLRRSIVNLLLADKLSVSGGYASLSSQTKVWFPAGIEYFLRYGDCSVRLLSYEVVGEELRFTMQCISDAGQTEVCDFSDDFSEDYDMWVCPYAYFEEQAHGMIQEMD